jgi:predicted ArsR family transcriptional regulator
MSDMIVGAVRAERSTWFSVGQIAQRLGMSSNALVRLLLETVDEDMVSRALMKAARNKIAQLQDAEEGEEDE